MSQAFGIVIFAVVIISTIIALGAFMGSSKLYDQIGRSGLSFDREARPEADLVSPTTAAVREEEISQLLEAANARRARRGQPPVDIGTELRRLTDAAPTVDPALRGEIRDMVMARNARRLRRGEQPLDVEAEVARRLAELGRE